MEVNAAYLFGLIFVSVLVMVIAISKFHQHPFIVMTVISIAVGLIWGVDPGKVVDTVKSKVGGGAGEYRYSDKGENGYAYPDADAPDKVTEVFESMKEKAPEVIGKVQDIVEDLREKAPEYKEKAQNIAETVKDAAKKIIDENKKDGE